MNLTYVIPSTIAGLIYLYLYLTYERRSKWSNYVLAILGLLVDWYPVFFGGMLTNLTTLGLVHGLLTILSYLILALWFISYEKPYYNYFLIIWFIAYLFGYLS